MRVTYGVTPAAQQVIGERVLRFQLNGSVEMILGRDGEETQLKVCVCVCVCERESMCVCVLRGSWEGYVRCEIGLAQSLDGLWEE